MLLSAAQLRVDKRHLQVMLLMSSQRLQCYLPLLVQLFPSAAVFLLSPQWLALLLLKGTCQMACFLGGKLCKCCSTAARNAASTAFVATMTEPSVMWCLRLQAFEECITCQLNVAEQLQQPQPQ